MIRDNSIDEVLQQAASHAKAVHGVDVTPELAEKVKAATRTE